MHDGFLFVQSILHFIFEPSGLLQLYVLHMFGPHCAHTSFRPHLMVSHVSAATRIKKKLKILLEMFDFTLLGICKSLQNKHSTFIKNCEDYMIVDSFCTK